MVFLVVGASGQQGGAVARELLARGQKIRVLTRDAKKVEPLRKMGAEVAIGDLGDADSLREALQGVEGAFLMTTFFEQGTDAETEQGRTFIEVAEEVGLPRLVYTSVAGADMAPEIPHFVSKWRVEQELHASDLDWTILRPVYFMENFSRAWVGSMMQQGVLSLPLPEDFGLTMIAVQDIGKAVAVAMLTPEKFAGRTLQLGAEEVPMHSVALELSSALGATIAYQEMGAEEAEKKMGAETVRMYRWFVEVGFSYDPLVEEQLGFRLTRFDDYLASAEWVGEVAAGIQ